VTAYTLGDVARICGVSRRRLRYWERTALLVPALHAAEQPTFGFRDLVAVRSIVGMLELGIPLRRIRRSAEAVRERFPDVEPVAALHPWQHAPGLAVHRDGRWMDPDGQLLLDFGRDPRDGGVEPLAGRLGARETLRVARAWFERGCELDTRRSTWDAAIQAYQRALELDPGFADAHCNLGSVFFNQGRRDEARICFERAVEHAPRHLEAHLNLGTLAEEQSADERALRHYRAALESDPLFPDVHVSLALLYEKLGLRRTARVHWRRYLALEPEGSWARVARSKLVADS
jgi:DNA-binding transcriptional MerR regulator